MISPDAASNVMGIIGIVMSLGLFLSSATVFRRICKLKDVEEFKPDPYLATLLNCMLWVFYGLPIVQPNSILVVTINGIGLVIEAIYLIIFFTYATKQKRLKMLAILAVEAVFMVIVVRWVLMAAHTHEKRSKIVGSLCVIFDTMMYASALTIMREVIMMKSVEYMPFFLSLVSFLNAVCWTSYTPSSASTSTSRSLPNGIATVVGLGQLILYACYYKSTPKKEKNFKLPTVVFGDVNSGNVTMSGPVSRIP